MADGTSCKSITGLSATCASGQCTSRDQQCVGSGTVTTVKACPQFGNDCQLNCQDSAGNCFQLTGNFLDGTTCGGTGRCKKGVCEGSTLSNFLFNPSLESYAMDTNFSSICMAYYCHFGLDYTIINILLYTRVLLS